MRRSDSLKVVISLEAESKSVGLVAAGVFAEASADLLSPTLLVAACSQQTIVSWYDTMSVTTTRLTFTTTLRR